MKKAVKMVAAIGLTAVALFNMTGCTSLAEMILGPIIKDFFDGLPPIDWHVPTFEERCVTTEDGFTYFMHYRHKDEKSHLCLLGVPEVEELTIPEYIDGKKVEQLGITYQSTGYRKECRLVGTGVKKLIIKYPVDLHMVAFPDVETVVYYDYLYTSLELAFSTSPLEDQGDCCVDICSWGSRENPGHIELRLTDRELEISEEYLSKITEIELPSTVTVIESGVFDGIDNAVIKTSCESKPDGWEEGWNGNCLVEWGQEVGTWTMM